MRGKPTTSSQCSAASSRATFYAPRDSRHAPRGYYMLFAVTNPGDAIGRPLGEVVMITALAAHSMTGRSKGLLSDYKVDGGIATRPGIKS